MKRALLAAITILCSQSLLGCGGEHELDGVGTATGASDPVATAESALTLIEGFETGWGGFVTDHHLACEPGCGPLQWSLARSTARAQSGVYSLSGTINGEHDDGTIWIERTVPVPAGRSSVMVTIDFYLWSPSVSSVNNWPVLAYAGVADPEKEGDFTIIGQTNQVAGWKKYSLSRAVAPGWGSSSIWVALGFGATWETTRTYALDSVTISVN